MGIPERLAALRQKMAEHGIDAYLVPTDDFHGSEYVGDYFACRRYLTGFTGSAGEALVTEDGAYLWTDGRYFLQAEEQLEGSGITLMKIGEEGVPTIEEFLRERLKDGEVLGFDGRCMSAGKGDRLAKLLKKKGAAVWAGGSVRENPEEGARAAVLDLVGAIWPDRPALSCGKVWSLEIAYAGKSRAEKLSELRAALAKKECTCHLLTSLDDIAWLLNLRGSDIRYNPVFLSYLLVTPQEVRLYAQREAFDGEILRALEADGVRLCGYGEIYADARRIPAGECVLLDSSVVNYALWRTLEHVKRVDGMNPSMLAKAVKNPVEMAHLRTAHRKDGVAVTRFMYWLKKQIAQAAQAKDGDISRDGDISQDEDISRDGDIFRGRKADAVTELSAAEKLLQLRREQEHFLDLSFETIAAYGPHGAIVHYGPTEESNAALAPASFLLVDSGGQYLEGTTDITRTFACGSLTAEEKEAYTRVLRGNLNLAAAKFRHGASGMAFDYLARQPLWEVGRDYNHGTGHGVGFLLNVHEAPNSFSYKVMQGRRLPCVFEEGMVTSDEPGFYLEGKFGVRCENLLLCVKAEKTAYGQFLRFETLTMVPWDLDAVEPKLLTQQEKELLNAYHRDVREALSPYLDEEERAWLEEATRAI